MSEKSHSKTASEGSSLFCFALLCAIIDYLSILNWIWLSSNGSSDQMTHDICVISLEKPSPLPGSHTSCLKCPPLKFERDISPNAIWTFLNSHHTPSKVQMISKYCYLVSSTVVSAQHTPTWGKFLPPISSFRALRIVDYIYWNNTQKYISDTIAIVPLKGTIFSLPFSKINREKNILHGFLSILSA